MSQSQFHNICERDRKKSHVTLWLANATNSMSPKYYHIFFNTTNNITLIYENLFQGTIEIIKSSAQNLYPFHI